MGQVVKIHQPHHFSLKDARELLPVVRKITKKAVEEFLILEEKLQHYQGDPVKWKSIEQEIAEVLNHWSEKVMNLGGIPKGIWLVDFDSGEGYFCWRYGDQQIQYFHGYGDGFAGRVAIS